MRLAALLAASLLLAACGFRLQGAPDLPAHFARTFVVAEDPYSPLVRELARALDGTNAELIEDLAAASAVIRILKDDVDQRVLTVSAQGQPREYEIVYRVTFEVGLAGGRKFEPQTLELRRDYPFDETDVLGRAREAQFLVEGMRRDVAELIVRRMVALRPSASR